MLMDVNGLPFAAFIRKNSYFLQKSPTINFLSEMVYSPIFPKIIAYRANKRKIRQCTRTPRDAALYGAVLPDAISFS